MSLPAISAYTGSVVHKRLHPVIHALKYRVFTLLLDVDRLEETSRNLRFFSHNGFNLFSLYDSDHGPGDGTAISTHVRGLLGHLTAERDIKKIMMLCYPRVLGYVFNPLTVYLAMDGAGGIQAVIYEVNNTFGGRKAYVVPVSPEDTANDVIAQSCRKELYVSPFNDTEGEYGFRITRPDEHMCVGVSLRGRDGPFFKAYFAGAREELTDRFLLMSMLRFPLQTYKVIASIHFEALKLWLKGLRIKSREPAADYSPIDTTSSRNSGKTPA
ncbi:MAG: DUF1365 domain-containing protein [Hyphomicrobiales bacterium]